MVEGMGEISSGNGGKSVSILLYRAIVWATSDGEETIAWNTTSDGKSASVIPPSNTPTVLFSSSTLSLLVKEWLQFL
jgi:hypothetical protein